MLYKYANLHHCYVVRLTYKYSRLMDEAYYKDGELPASEKCTLDEGEEEDEVILLICIIIWPFSTLVQLISSFTVFSWWKETDSTL